MTPLVWIMLPATAAALWLMLPRLWSGSGDPTAHATYRAILRRVIAFILALHGLVLAVFSDVTWVHPWAARAAMVMFGSLIIAVGNLLPRTRPNLVFGLRTRRALADRALWIETHRLAGYAAVGIGVVIVLAGMFLSSRAIPNVIGTAAMLGAGAIAVTYWRASHG